ncbi:MAG: hypothetical protein HY929_09325 [Euryarchaeota archaeon]|nr:hypothetical protein [Euryarchaeota archaeon]
MGLSVAAPTFVNDRSLLRYVRDQLLLEKFCDICGKPKRTGHLLKLKMEGQLKKICFECFGKLKLNFDQVKIK